MTDVLLFHHALGLTDGVRAFADDIRAAGHQVTLPDLYEGRTFDTIDAGVAYAQQVGFDAIMAAAEVIADGLAPSVVYAGMSLGVMPAQRLAQRRPDTLGALLLHSAVPAAEFGEGWPPGVPLQIHVMADDPWGDVEDGRQLAADAGGEIFTYSGSDHLFTDRSRNEHDPEAAALVLERSLAFLDRLAHG